MNLADLKLKPDVINKENGLKKAVNSILNINYIHWHDIDYDLIRRLETTTAEIHDSQIDLIQPGEVVYRDLGYFGAPCKGI
ncbi:hypothetical protein JCM15415_09630 [Methanobacterium movens]